MLDSKKRTGSGTHSYRWKYHPTPWKLFIDAVTKPQETILPRFGNKRFVLGIVALIVISGGVVLAQGPLLHSEGTTISDPATLIWQATDPNNNFGEFTLQGNGLTDCTTSCGPFFNGNGNVMKFNTTQSGTNTLVVLSKSTVGDLGIISGKGLQAAFNWGAAGSGFAPNSSGGSSTDVWGYYLTSNKTIPTHAIGSSAAYNPRDDPSVVYILELYVTGANQITHVLLFQRSTTNAIGAEDNGCNGGSSCFLATTITAHPVTNIQWSTVQLNFTGVTGPSGTCTPTGGGCSMLFAGDTATAQVGTQNIPWFKYQGQSYYLGIYALPASNAGYTIYWSFQGGTLITPTGKAMNLAYFVVAPNTPVAIDTGGFFGPLVRALINIAVFIAQNIINALTFLASVLFPVLATVFAVLANALVGALNAIGNFFGLGNIGTTIQSFFTAIGNFLVNGVGAVLAQIGNAISFFVNGTTAFVNIAGTYWAKITSFFTALGNLLSILGTVITDLLALGSFSGNLALFMDWTWGMYKTYDEGTEGFHRWLDFNENVFLRIGKLAYFLSDHLFTIILRVKQLIVQWI